MKKLLAFLEQIFYLFKQLRPWQQDLVLLALLVISVLVIIKITQWWIIPLLKKLINLSKNKADDRLVYNYLLPVIKFAPPALLIIFISQSFQTIPHSFFEKTGKCILVVTIIVILTRVIDDVVAIIKKINVSEKLHIRGIAQAIKLLVYLFGGIFIVAILIDQTPWTLLGGLGALTAVIILVFRDVILGLVAGIQLSANNMIKIGDWVELPEHGVDGSVIDILLSTVKIENWDKSVTFLPAYVLISKSFKNWRAMQDLGVRRIKRNIYINITSIRFLQPDEINQYKTIPHLKKFFTSLKHPAKLQNTDPNTDPNTAPSTAPSTNPHTPSNLHPSSPSNETLDTTPQQKITNPNHPSTILQAIDTEQTGQFTHTTASLFRSYTLEYLLSHPKIRNDLTVLARMMAPTAKGMGLQLYCFTDTSDFLEYEAIQSSVFEHLIATAELLGLSIFQDPSGLDMRELYRNS